MPRPAQHLRGRYVSAALPHSHRASPFLPPSPCTLSMPRPPPVPRMSCAGSPNKPNTVAHLRGPPPACSQASWKITMNIIRFCSSLLSAAAPLSLHSFECMQYHTACSRKLQRTPRVALCFSPAARHNFGSCFAPPLFHSLYSGILLDHYWQPEQCDAHSPDHCPSLPALTALPARAGPLVAGPRSAKSISQKQHSVPVAPPAVHGVQHCRRWPKLAHAAHGAGLSRIVMRAGA
jgi:hypothetical protein